MDFATEEKLCRLAHEVWRQVAAEPEGLAECRGAGQAAEAGHEVPSSLHLRDVFALDSRDWLAW